MITVEFTGNLGNKLFQLWALIGIGKTEKQPIRFPESELYQYFAGEFPVGHLDAVRLNEPGFDYAPINKYNPYHPADDISLKGYYQSEKYWAAAEKECRKTFKFKKDFYYETRNKLPGLFDKEVICISIRRGDFVNNPTYYQLRIEYYIGALIKYFPDFQTNYNLLVMSDDMDYCHAHFDCLDNVYYADGLTAMEQLCIGSQADHHIISNSTFSWWVAYLSKSKTVIRPKYNFSDTYRATHPETDFWPDKSTWHTHDDDAYRIDLSDTTFMIPVFHDHNDRKQNVDLTVCLLQRAFKTNITVMENNGNRLAYQSQWCEYVPTQHKYFHRTRMLNDMAVAATTPYVVNWDADVVIPPLQIYLSIQTLRTGDCDFCYPYDGRFVRVLRKPNYKTVCQTLDIGALQNADTFSFAGMSGKPMAANSVGGAVAMNREKFILSGMENEHMVSYAPEDCERWDRWHMLGYKVVRTKGKLYHMDHWCGPDSCSYNPFFYKNHQELDKIRAMHPDDLQAYVKDWGWRTRAVRHLSVFS